MSAHLNINHMAPVMRMGRHEMWYYPNNGTYMYRERGKHQRRFIKEGEPLRKFLTEMDAKTGVYGAFTAWMKRILRDTAKIHRRYRAAIMLHNTAKAARHQHYQRGDDCMYPHIEDDSLLTGGMRHAIHSAA